MAANTKNSDKFPRDIPTPTRSWQQRLLALCIILVILAVGLLIAKRLMDTKPKAVRKPPTKMQTLVEVEKAIRVSTASRIKALGRVVPDRDIILQAEVSGSVLEMHPDFRPGGIIKKGEVLLRIEDVDYQLALEQKQNRLAQAKADLRIEEGEELIARQEWEVVNNEIPDLDRNSLDLVLRKPQQEKARANVSIAATEVRLARINVERTVIRAPFNCVVREKKIDLGSRVTSQSPLAVLSGIDTFRAEISVPLRELDWIDLPQGDKAGAVVKVSTHDETAYEGRIISLLPDLDQDGLMARLLIAITDPLGLKSGRAPLLLGSFITAEIIGRELADVFQVPRRAVLGEEKVLLVTAEKALHIQPVTIVWMNEEFMFVNQGLSEGDQIIVSSVAAPIEGMALNTGISGARKQKIDSEKQP